MKKLFFGLILAVPVQAFAASEGHALDWAGLGWRVLLFVIFAALMYRILRKPLVNMFFKRTEDIEKALKSAINAKEEALKQVKEYEQKMKELETELVQMKENALKAAEKDRERIIADAERSVAKMKQFAINMIEAETMQAKADIKREIVNLVMQEAEKQIANDVTGAKSKVVLDDYIKRIGE